MIRLVRPPCPDPAALATNYKAPQNKEALREASAAKCMYCEAYVTAVYHGDVEHIKPKAKFPESEFDWDNLGFACAKCNGAKGDKWDERTPFVDPYSEDPADFLVPVGNFLFPRPGSDRGEYSIREIALNRPDLLLQRQERIEEVARLAAVVARSAPANRPAREAELDAEVGVDRPFSAVAQAAWNGMRH